MKVPEWDPHFHIDVRKVGGEVILGHAGVVVTHESDDNLPFLWAFTRFSIIIQIYGVVADYAIQ